MSGSINNGTGIKEEPKNQRASAAYNCSQDKGRRVGASDVDQPSRCGDADNSRDGCERIAESKQHGAVALSDIEKAR